MPEYQFQCDCGFQDSVICSISEMPTERKCNKCGKAMYRKYSFNCGQRGDYEHISDSLAISPSQIQEHRQLFPDVEVLPTGQVKFNSVRQQDKYLKKTGFVKRTKGKVTGP